MMLLYSRFGESPLGLVNEPDAQSGRCQTPAGDAFAQELRAVMEDVLEDDRVLVDAGILGLDQRELEGLDICEFYERMIRAARERLGWNESGELVRKKPME